MFDFSSVKAGLTTVILLVGIAASVVGGIADTGVISQELSYQIAASLAVALGAFRSAQKIWDKDG